VLRRVVPHWLRLPDLRPSSSASRRRPLSTAAPAPFTYGCGEGRARPLSRRERDGVRGTHLAGEGGKAVPAPSPPLRGRDSSPPGLASGKPEDRLREQGEGPCSRRPRRSAPLPSRLPQPRQGGFGPSPA
jgi:hypothetical protein